MQRVLIVGASGGIGAAMAELWRAQGAEVTALSRRDDGLDITDEASIRAHLGALTGRFDVVFVATGALSGAGARPEKSISAVTAAPLLDQYAVNAVGPMLVLKHARRLLPKRERAVFAALSARVGSIGDNRAGGWYAYRAAKAGLNQLIHGAAIELARSHPGAICITLHPGTVATPFTADFKGRHEMVVPSEAAENLVRVIDGLTPADTGGFFDYAGQAVPW